MQLQQQRLQSTQQQDHLKAKERQNEAFISECVVAPIDPVDCCLSEGHDTDRRHQTPAAVTVSKNITSKHSAVSKKTGKKSFLFVYNFFLHSVNYNYPYSFFLFGGEKSIVASAVSIQSCIHSPSHIRRYRHI
jgi:hypothetical protein